MDIFSGFEGLDGVIGELDTSIYPYIRMRLDGIDRISATYVKPFMMLYSCLMTPPFSLAVSLALKRDVSTKVFKMIELRHTFPTPRWERWSLE